MSAEMPEHWVPKPFEGEACPWLRVPLGIAAYAEAYARKHAEKVAAELAALRAAARDAETALRELEYPVDYSLPPVDDGEMRPFVRHMSKQERAADDAGVSLYGPL